MSAPRSLKMPDMPVADATIEPGKLLAMDSGKTTGKVRGEEAREPASNNPETWIDASQRNRARCTATR
jgi:flagellar biosynthesis protein FlhA